MIRKIKSEDAQSIQKICTVALDYAASIELVKKQIDKLIQDDVHHYIYVYEDEKVNTVVGFIHAEVYESLYAEVGLNILGLAVLPEFQGKGIGKQLIHQLEIQAKKNTIAFIRLNSGEQRMEAHQFYENSGYICNKLQKRFIKMLK